MLPAGTEVAPEQVLQMTRCKCASSQCRTNRCSCVRVGLNCTEFCRCQECVNRRDTQDSDDESEDDNANLSKGHFWNLHEIFFQMRPNNAMFEEFLNFNNFFSDVKSVRTSTGRKKNCSTLGMGNFGFLDSPKVILTENQIKTHIYPMSGLPQKFSSGHWTKAVTQRCSIKSVFLKVSESSQENTYTSVLFRTATLLNRVQQW